MWLACFSLLTASLLHAQSANDQPYCELTPEQRKLLRHLSHEDERPRIVIDDVVFEGQVNLPEEVRQKLVEDIRSQEFFAGSSWEGHSEALARDAWQDLGYYAVMVNETSQFASQQGNDYHVKVTLRVEEGAQYHLGSVQFQPANPEIPALSFPPEQLRPLVPVKYGDVFAVGKIREGLDELRRFYGARGYIELTAQTTTSPDPERKLVDLILALDEHGQYRIGNLYFQGAEPQTEAMFRANFKTGEIINDRALWDFFRANQKRLPPGEPNERVGWELDPKLHTVDLRIDLRPCPAPVN